MGRCLGELTYCLSEGERERMGRGEGAEEGEDIGMRQRKELCVHVHNVIKKSIMSSVILRH